MFNLGPYLVERIDWCVWIRGIIMGGEGGFCGGMINCCSRVRKGMCSWQLGRHCFVHVGSQNRI